MKKLKHIIDSLSCSEKEKIDTYRKLCVLFGVSEWRDLSEKPNVHEIIEVMYEDYTTEEGAFAHIHSFDMEINERRKSKSPMPVKWRYSIS